jgi:PEP-CTERM motif
MKMSKLVLLALAIVGFSTAAFADQQWNDIDGMLHSKVGTTGYYLTNVGSGSTITSVTGAGDYNCNPCVGKVAYTTGMTSGFNPSFINVLTPGVLTDLGSGTIAITLPGVGGGPGGLVFSGNFTGITWQYIGTCTAGGCATGQYYQWEIMGHVSGTYYFSDGTTHQAQGFNVQLTTMRFHGNDPFANGTGSIAGGVGGVSLGITPEPRTLILFGTGLVGIALFVRRRRPSGLQT